LLVDDLYCEAIDAVKSQAVLSACSPELIWIPGEMDSRPGYETLCRLFNRVQEIPGTNMTQQVKSKLSPEYQRQCLLTAGQFCAQQY
jgi:hypothetical protein